MNKQVEQKVSLPIWQLLSLVVSVAVSAGGIGVWNVSQLWELDRRWQDRMSTLAVTLNDELTEIRSTIPPNLWLRMVEQNQEEIDRLTTEIRDLRNRLNDQS